MYCPKKMCLTKFKQVNIPTTRDLFNRMGYRIVKDSGSSADAIFNERKLDQLARLSGFDQLKMSEEERISTLQNEPPQDSPQDTPQDTE